MEMPFALIGEFEFKVFTLAIDFQIRIIIIIVTFGNQFLNLSSHF